MSEDIQNLRRLAKELAQAAHSIPFSDTFTQGHVGVTSASVAKLCDETADLYKLVKQFETQVQSHLKQVRRKKGWAGEPLADRIKRLGLD